MKMSRVFQKLLKVKLSSPPEAVFTHPAHTGAVLPRSASSCCSSAVVAWSKVVKDLNPADLWILFIMSTDY